MEPGVDDFGFTRSQRIAMADDELAKAQEMGRELLHSDQKWSLYARTLYSAAALYSDEGFGLLARRVRRLARDADVFQAWATFERLNSKETF